MNISLLSVNDALACEGWYQVTQEKVDAFAKVTEDFQWIHIDQARCEKESPFKTTIAHGFLTAALMPKMFAQCVSVDPQKNTMLNYGIDKLRYLEPVRVNDEIKFSFVLSSIERKPMGSLYRFSTQVDIKGRDKPALVGEFLMLLL
ncbi:MaoC family dehydratase N-terminal domain-containing protein [Glaciecola sp. XM2]|jgi:acyl dehydratase|uniref:MaoC/PaaZ C-terminal domain-containing protein n=1 Tax=Glaciecola sp. XM2 TaxID=1914931 RepID=UPI001BDEDC49|nr:MaoC/PaaZ C-terminal domain-containing protein [Glaciecola sp. XM2]MBT1449434.1 MaoC family dehydratase N-terminal domain-containing protein [Glaciecola sp. XM2]